MFEYAHRQTFLARVRRRSIQFIRWSPVLIVALLLRNWSESFEAFHSWTGLTLDYPGEYRLDRHIELTVLGLLLLGLGVRWRVCPPWRTLLSASFRQWSTLALAYLLILALAIFITNDRAFFNDFRPIDPMDQPRAWWIFLATLLLGAWQQEIWGRAILQSTLRRMVDCRWIAIVLNAVLLSIDQPGHRADTFCLAILLGIVFTHTRSLVCTTAIHLVVDLSLDVLQGGPSWRPDG
ncbi:CPBP family intramembrane glutamic endopeptidase [Roseateles chitinivorans]|uniref:CPBP family intramembrane glutamic endopeptidase n=1 Tax=Roseateles chitinivorans TaxID=2917965 RepID=UPI003D6670D6